MPPSSLSGSPGRVDINPEFWVDYHPHLIMVQSVPRVQRWLTICWG